MPCQKHKMPGGPWPLTAHASQFHSDLSQPRLGEAGLGQFSAARVIRMSKADHVLFNLITEVGGSSSLCRRRWAKGGSRRVRQPRTFVKGRKPQKKGPMKGSS